MSKYFLKYSSVFKIIDCNTSELPPHLFYYIHTGGKVSTDIDLKKVIPFVRDNFFGSEKNRLKNNSPDVLKSKVLMLHNTLIEKPEPGYRELMAYVPFQNAPTDVAGYLRGKYANKDKEIEEKIKVIENFRAYTRTIGQEIILDLATEKNQKLYKSLVQALIKYIYPITKELFSEVSTADTVTLEIKPAAKRRLITLLRLNPECKQFYEKFFQEAKQYIQSSAELCEEYHLRQAQEVDTQALLNTDSTTRNIMLDLFREYQFVPVLPNNIEEEMENFFITLSSKLSSNEDPFIIAAWVCTEYTRIHPKNNGNGRTSRFLANIILAQHGIVPVIFNNDQEYTQKIRAANDNLEIFTQYLYENALESANLYLLNPTAYSCQFQHFSNSDLDAFENVKVQRQLFSKLGIVNTYGMERKDYDPLQILTKQKSTSPQSVITIKKVFIAVEKAAKKEYGESNNYELAKMLYEDAVKLRMNVKSNNVALAVLHVNIASCCEHLLNPIDETKENLIRAKNLIKFEPTQEGLLNQINKKLEKYTQEKNTILETTQTNTLKLIMNE